MYSRGFYRGDLYRGSMATDLVRLKQVNMATCQTYNPWRRASTSPLPPPRQPHVPFQHCLRKQATLQVQRVMPQQPLPQQA